MATTRRKTPTRHSGPIIHPQDIDHDEITALRKRLGISQNQMSKLLGVSNGTWNQVERGKSGARLTVLQNAAKILKTDLGAIAHLPGMMVRDHYPERPSTEEFQVGMALTTAPPVGTAEFPALTKILREYCHQLIDSFGVGELVLAIEELSKIVSVDTAAKLRQTR